MAIYSGGIYSDTSDPAASLTFPLDPFGDDITISNSDYSSITANSTDDALFILAGSDIGTVNAGDGTDDVTVTSSDVDFLYGFAGVDTFTITSSDIFALFGGADGDDISIASSTVDYVYGEGGSDTIAVDGSTVIDLNGGAAGDDIDVTGSSILGSLSGGDGGDDIDVVDSLIAGDLMGGSGTDTIDIDGVVLGMIDGGSDNDTITLDLNAIVGDVSGGAGVDTLNLAGAVLGSVDGGADGDTINIGSAKVSGLVAGGAGTDTIVSGYFDDLISGGTDADTFVFGAFTGTDVITDFEDGVDFIQFESGVDYFFQLEIEDLGTDTLISHGQNSIILVGVDAADINVTDFKIDGGVAMTNDLIGTPGIDSLGISDGETVTSVDALGDNDSIILENGAVTNDVHGGDGNDLIIIGSNDNAAEGTTGVAVPVGGTIYGDAGKDTIRGGKGDETINGGLGNDSISGGQGTDTAVFSGTKADYTATYTLIRDPVSGTEQVIGTIVGPDGTDTIDPDVESFVFLGDGGSPYTWDEVFNDSNPVFTSSTTGTLEENSTGVAYDANVSDADQPGADDDPTTPAPVGVSTDLDVIYTITGGADAALFEFIPDGGDRTGQIRFVSPPDAENQSDSNNDGVYEVEIGVSDDNGTTVITQLVSITVTDKNEFAPVFTTGTTASVAENSVGVVYDADATDDDISGPASITYSLGGTDAGQFTINSVTGEVSFSGSPDYEAPTDTGGNNEYDIVVTASDGSFTTNRSVKISVTNENDTAPVFTSGATANFAENATGTVYDANTTDVDGPAATYSLSGTDQALFNIDSVTGAVTFINPPDFETALDVGGDNVYDIIVTASDTVNSTPQAVAITVTDVVEIVNAFAPVFTSGTAVNFAENGAGTAYDADATDGDGTLPTYSISGGADAGLFTINATTGQVTFLVPPDYESPLDVGTNNVYDIEVTATDGTNSVAQSVTITVTNVSPESIVLQGTAGNDTLTATTGDDYILNGEAGDDVMTGDIGNDIFNPGPGIDIMTGGGGVDTFVITDGSGGNTITDFNINDGDLVDLSAVTGIRDFDDVLAAARSTFGGGTWISLPDGTKILMQNVTIGDLSSDDFVYSVSPIPTSTTLSATETGNAVPDSEGGTQLPPNDEDDGFILGGKLGQTDFASSLSFKDQAHVQSGVPTIGHDFVTLHETWDWVGVNDTVPSEPVPEIEMPMLLLLDEFSPFGEIHGGYVDELLL